MPLRHADGVLKLYEPGSEGPQWWSKWPDRARGLPTRGILDRCKATRTCPKIIEHFGAAEVWGLELGPEWVGTDPRTDIPLPKNVRRYYIPCTRHGGGIFPDNPVPHTETRNAIQHHFRNWVWNITASGFHAGKIRGYAGGMIPFAKTRAEREANEDPRLSLEERYGSHAGYVAAVRKAAARAMAEGFLLQADADALVAAAEASNVLNP